MYLTEARKKQHKDIESQTDIFFANGKKITSIKTGQSALKEGSNKKLTAKQRNVLLNGKG